MLIIATTFIIKANEQENEQENEAKKRTMDTQRRKELADTPIDIQRRKEFVKEKRIEKLIRKEEYEDAINNLPINERAIIKDVELQIKSDNHKMFLDKLRREGIEKMIIRQEQRLEDERDKERESSLMKNVCIMCVGAVGTVAYVGLAIITR